MSIIRFNKLVPWGPSPTRADPSLFGSVPLRAYQYCQPFTEANGFGWYVYPPINFMIQWDGVEYYWRPIDSKQWNILHSAHIPNLQEHYKALFSDSPEGTPNIIPFLTSVKESNIIQVWSGLSVETEKNWSILSRRPANIGKNLGYEHLEGIIETDWWTGPLIFAISITRTNIPVVFHINRPFLHIQPIPRKSYSKEIMDDIDVVESQDITETFWLGYRASEKVHDESKPGGYKRAVKKCMVKT